MKKSDKELKSYELRVANTVNDMDENVRNRFKALAHISNMLAELSTQYEAEAKKIEYDAEEDNKPLYFLRNQIIQGKEIDGTEQMLEEYESRFEEVKDEDYDKIKVKEFKKVAQLAEVTGIPGFWYNAIKHSTMLGTLVLKKDEKLLRELHDIELINQEGSNDFILKFHFNPNDFMSNTVLTKRYIMEDQDKIKQIDCTEIKWRKGKNLMEKSKKKGKKGAAKYEDDEEESFFKFFTAKEACKGDPDKDDLDEEDEMRLDDLEEDYDIAMEFKSETLPNALEYYLNIVEEEPLEEGEGEEEAPVPDDQAAAEANSDGSVDD